MPKMIYIVTTNTVPYVYHVPAILALPSNYRYHFRYRRKYIHTDTDAKLKSMFERQPAILWFKAQRDGKEYFVPLRRGTFSQVRDYGQFAFFDLRLGPLVRLENGPDTVKILDALSESNREVIANTLPAANRDKNIFSVEARFLPTLRFDAEVSTEETTSLWADLAFILSQFDGLKEITFFRLVAVTKNSQPEEVVVPHEHISRGIELRLEEGESYRFAMMQYHPGGSFKPFDFKMVFDANYVDGLRSAVKIDGRYDAFDLLAAPRRPGSPILRFESAQVLPESHSVPPLELTLFVPSRRRWTRFVLIMLASIALYVLPSLVESIQQNSELAFILKVFGIAGIAFDLFSISKSWLPESE